MRLSDFIEITSTHPVAALEGGTFYRCEGIDGNADYTYFMKAGDYFVSGLAWNNADGTLRLLEEEMPRQQHLYFGLLHAAVDLLSVGEAYLALTELLLNNRSDIIAGSGTEHGCVEHSFTGDPLVYLLKAEPIFKILAASNRDAHSYIFSLVTVSGDDIDDVEYLTEGFVRNADDMDMIDGFLDLLDDNPDMVEASVTSHTFTVGKGESDDMPDDLLREVAKYGAEDFIQLDIVDQLERCDFEVDTEDYI